MFPSPVMRNLPKCLDWETVTLKNGQTFEGCKVGAVVEVNTHFDGVADRVCVRWASGGVIQCGACEKFSASPCRGYLPMLTKLGERRVMLLSETVIPKVRNLPQGTALRFTRPTAGKRPVTVQLLGEYDLGGDFMRKCKQFAPFTIFEYLLHLWQKPELNRFFNVDHYPALRPTSAADFKEQAAGT